MLNLHFFFGIFHLKNLQTLSLAYIWTLSPDYLMFPWQTEHLLYLHYSLDSLCQLWDPSTLIIDLPVISAASNHFPTSVFVPSPPFFKIKYYLFMKTYQGALGLKRSFLDLNSSSPNCQPTFRTSLYHMQNLGLCLSSVPILCLSRQAPQCTVCIDILPTASVTITGQDGWSIDLLMFQFM